MHRTRLHRRGIALANEGSLAGTDRSGNWSTRSEPDVRQDVRIAADSSCGKGLTLWPKRFGQAALLE